MLPNHSTNPSKRAAVGLLLDLFDYLVFNDHRLSNNILRLRSIAS